MFRVPGVTRMDGKISNECEPGEIAAWMPFSSGGMKCPSAEGYAVRIVATVVGVILRALFPGGEDDVFSRRWWCEGIEENKLDVPHFVGRGDHSDGGEREKTRVLKAGRNEYGGVQLCVMDMMRG